MEKIIIYALCMALTQLCYSQPTLPCGDIHVCRIKKGYATRLIADETKMTVRKTVAIVRCYDEQTAKDIIEAHKQIIKRYNWRWIWEDGKRIKRYIIYFNKKDAELIELWAKTNL